MKGHLVNPITNEWYEYDERYRLWSCDCKSKKGMSLCLSICDCLDADGKLNELKRQIALKKKELGFLQGKQ